MTLNLQTSGLHSASCVIHQLGETTICLHFYLQTVPQNDGLFMCKPVGYLLSKVLFPFQGCNITKCHFEKFNLADDFCRAPYVGFQQYPDTIPNSAPDLMAYRFLRMLQAHFLCRVEPSALTRAFASNIYRYFVPYS